MSGIPPAIRAAYPQALATLTRVLGDLDRAQDALHDAVGKALIHWQGELPENPAAWLVRTARNAAIDGHRRQAVAARSRETLRQATGPEADGSDEALVDGFRDDMLRLLFTCCHPSLTPDAQVALALRTVVGLGVGEIARAYRVGERTMEQRLTRAKRTLQNAGAPYEIPSESDLPGRIEAVCAVILVLFNEGYSEAVDGGGIRPRLCALAIRLARLTNRLVRNDPEVQGLLALLLLQHARLNARHDGAGEVVTLEHQDRSRWDRRAIAEGQALVEIALRRRALGPYQIQAAIAAAHDRAPTFAQTDWEEIVLLYDALVRHRPTPVVELNRAIAVSRARGPEAGLAILDELGPRAGVEDYHLFQAALGHMREEAGDLAGARSSFRRALELAPGAGERTYLEKKIAALMSGSEPPRSS